METVATITRIAGTLKTAESIRAVGKNITGAVLAFILVCETKKMRNQSILNLTPNNDQRLNKARLPPNERKKSIIRKADAIKHRTETMKISATREARLSRNNTMSCAALLNSFFSPSFSRDAP